MESYLCIFSSTATLRFNLTFRPLEIKPFDNIENALDVRRASEYNAEHIMGLINFPLDFINAKMNLLDRNKKYYLHCAGGYRSMIAASILKARGFDQVVNIKGGYKALTETKLKRTEYVEQVTEL